MWHVTLFGPPGAGKGTQGMALSARLGVPHVSTGDMLREAVANGGELGEIARPILARGEYLPDNLMVGMLEERLSRPDARSGAVLDGFPRTMAQAEALDEILGANGYQLDSAVFLEVGWEELSRRIEGRQSCPCCGRLYGLEEFAPAAHGVCDGDGTALIKRDDDSPALALRRMEEYETRVGPLRDFYEATGRLLRVDGSLSPRQVERELERGLALVLAGRESPAGLG